MIVQSLFIIISIGMGSASVVTMMQGPCNFYDTINITSGHRDDKENFIYKDVVFRYGTYGLYDYVIENSTVKVFVDPHYRGCVCEYKPCIRLCCLESAGGKNERCLKTQEFQVETNDGEEKTLDIHSDEYGVLMGRPCNRMYQLEPQDYPDDHWTFLKNGSIHINSHIATTDEYCFGQRFNETAEKMTTEVLLCYIEQNDARFTVYPIGMLFSMPFLIITFCVYAFIPELRNLHGKCLMCYVLSLMILYTSLSVIQLADEALVIQTPQCVVIGHGVYMSVLLCFFWLNIMCYDIWSTFRGGISRGRGGDNKRFLYYSLYAFSLPMIMTLIVYILDTFKPFNEAYLAMIGIYRCWIRSNRLVEAIYVYTPISIIMIINIVLYSITAYKIWHVQKETSVIRNGDSQKHSKMEADTDRFFLYLRLFIIMGATWSMESISWVFNTSIIFYISDFLNCLQGFIIFLLFVWKPKIKKLIVRRYRSIRNLPPLPSASANSTRTETSQISSSGIRSQKIVSSSEKPMLYE